MRDNPPVWDLGKELTTNFKYRHVMKFYIRPRSSTDILGRHQQLEAVVRHCQVDEIKEHKMGRTCYMWRRAEMHSEFWLGNQKLMNWWKRKWEGNNKFGLGGDGTVCGLNSTDSG